MTFYVDESFSTRRVICDNVCDTAGNHEKTLDHGVRPTISGRHNCRTLEMIISDQFSALEMRNYCVIHGRTRRENQTLPPLLPRFLLFDALSSCFTLLEHLLEEACPGLDSVWAPVFRRKCDQFRNPVQPRRVSFRIHDGTIVRRSNRDAIIPCYLDLIVSGTVLWLTMPRKRCDFGADRAMRRTVAKKIALSSI